MFEDDFLDQLIATLDDHSINYDSREIFANKHDLVF